MLIIFAEATTSNGDATSLVTVVLGLIGIISAFVAIMTYVIKAVISQAQKDQKEHTKALVNQTIASKKQAESNQAVVKELKAFSKRQDNTGELLIALAKKIDINGVKGKP